MINAYYLKGYTAALEKEAGIKDIAKNLLLSTQLIGGVPVGGFVGGAIGHRPPTEAINSFRAYVEKMPVEDSAALVKKHAPNLNFKKTEEGTKDLAKYLREKSKVYASLTEDELAPLLAKDIGNTSLYNKDLNLMIGPEKMNPGILSHEIGHYLNQDAPASNQFIQDLTGRTLNQETKAWETARKLGTPIDKGLEDAAMNTYKTQTRNTQLGVGIGGIAGGAFSYRKGKKLFQNLKKRNSK